MTARPRFLALLPVALALVAYGSLIDTYFIADDFLHLYQIANGNPWRFLVTPHAGHLYLLRNLIFYLSFNLFGFYAAPFFVTVVLIHMVNAYLLFRLVSVLTGNAFLAAAVASFWGVSPINEGVLGWYSVFGCALVGTFTLWALGEVARVEAESRTLSVRRCAGWYALLLAAANCFGIGMGIAMVSGLIVFWLLPPSRRRSIVALGFASLAAVIPLLYAIVWRAYVSASGRVAEQAALVSLHNPVRFWRPMAALLSHLVAHGACNTLLAPINRDVCGRVISDSGAIVYAAVLAAILMGAWWWSSPATRRRLLAFTVVALASYGPVAAGRGSLAPYLGVALDSLANEPRYHYVAPLALWTLFALIVGEGSRRFPLAIRSQAVLLGGVTVLAMMSALRTQRGLDHHPLPRTQIAQVLDSIDSIVVWQPPGDIAFIKNRPFPTGGGAGELEFPGWAAVFIIAHPTDVVDGTTVRFVETDPRLLAVAQAETETRIGTLLVGPEYLNRVAPVPSKRAR